MPTDPAIRLPTDGSGQNVRVVQPPGHVSAAGDPVNQEVVTIADSQGNLLDATLAKLLPLVRKQT